MSLCFPEEFWGWERLFESEDGSLIEYGRPGETPQDWTEIFMIQVLPDAEELSPIDHCRAMVENLGQIYYALPLEYRLNSCDDTSFFLEWWCHEKPLRQHEWIKVIKREGQVYLIRFTTKRLSDLDEIKVMWGGAIKGAHIEEDEAVQEEWTSHQKDDLEASVPPSFYREDCAGLLAFTTRDKKAFVLITLESGIDGEKRAYDLMAQFRNQQHARVVGRFDRCDFINKKPLLMMKSVEYQGRRVKFIVGVVRDASRVALVYACVDEDEFELYRPYFEQIIDRLRFCDE